jgi:hypothetical protein
MRVFVASAAVFLAVLSVNATPNSSAPSPVISASQQMPERPNMTFEKYGPQSTARAVRASLRSALTPDPVSMAALLFCAFSLRWMRMRKEHTDRAKGSSHAALPGAA